MADELVSSLKSIRRFIDRKNIVVFYTPPRSQKNYNIFNKYAIVKEVDDETPPFKYLKRSPASRYGEVIGHFEKVSSPNLFIFDCDTIIKKDIKELLDGDFDVAYRPATMYKYVDKAKWEKLCSEYNKKPIPIPNKGFMIFKNNTHKKIRNECLNFMSKDLPEIFPKYYQKDQYSLALVLSGYKIKFLDKRAHAYHWISEFNTETYVLHGRSQNRLTTELKMIIWKIIYRFGN